MGDQLELVIVTIPAWGDVCGAGILDVLDLGTIVERTDDDPPPAEDDDDRFRRVRVAEALVPLIEHWSNVAHGQWDGVFPSLPAATVERITVDASALGSWTARVPWALPSVKRRVLKSFIRRGLLSGDALHDA